MMSITERLDAACYCSHRQGGQWRRRQLSSRRLPAQTTPLGTGGMLPVPERALQPSHLSVLQPRSVTARCCPLPSQGGHGATATPLSPAQPGAARRNAREGRTGPQPPRPRRILPMPGSSTPGGENPQEASPPRRAAPHPGTRARAARAARGSASSSCRSFPASARFQGARRSRRCSAARPGWEHAPRRHSSAPKAAPAARQPRSPRPPQELGQGWEHGESPGEGSLPRAC